MVRTSILLLLVATLAACAPIIDDGEALPEQQLGLKLVPARHCGHCGRIEAKREVAPRVYEYTLRMADGSSSVFQETLPTTWRVGERVGVIR
jgi:hypothetical protein